MNHLIKCEVQEPIIRHALCDLGKKNGFIPSINRIEFEREGDPKAYPWFFLDLKSKEFGFGMRGSPVDNSYTSYSLEEVITILSKKPWPYVHLMSGCVTIEIYEDSSVAVRAEGKSIITFSSGEVKGFVEKWQELREENK